QKTPSARSSAPSCSGGSSTASLPSSTAPSCASRSSRRTQCTRTSWSTPRSVPDALVGLDVGTSGVKGVAIDADGRVLATATAEYQLSRPHPGWSEQEPEDWWRAAQECLAQLPEGPIGVSGQMHGLGGRGAG